MRDIDDIVKDEIIDTIDNTLTIKTVTAVGLDGYQVITFCDMKYLKLFSYVTLGNFNYTIVSIVGQNVTVSTPNTHPVLVAGNVVSMPSIYYYRGTRKAVNTEFKLRSENWEELPLIWLVNPIEETFYRKDPRERSSEIRFFLLCNADFENDLTKDFREKNIVPLLALAESIYQSVNANTKMFNKLNEYRTRDFSKFGVEDTTGVIKSIIDSNVSGVDLRFTLETLVQPCNC